MKIAVIFVALFVACAAGEGLDDLKLVKQLKDIFDKCVEAKKPSPEVLKNLMLDEGQDDEATNGMRVCLMEEFGIITNGKLDIPKIDAMMSSCEVLQMVPDLHKTWMGIIKGCHKTSGAESAATVTEMAGKMSKCFKDIGDKIKAIIETAAAAGA